MMTDEELAKARQGVPIDRDANGTEIDPMRSLLAELVVQATRIANNTDKPVMHLNPRDIAKAWESTGMRMYEDRFTDGLKALGIVIDK